MERGKLRHPTFSSDSRKSKLKKTRVVFWFLFLLICLQVNNLKADSIFEDLKKSYHFSNQIKEWMPADTPQIFIGEDLFLFINGGAEIYHEYGFNQAMSLEYKNKKNKSINLEIYEMKDSKSAFGIFTYKTGKDGEKIAIGHDALLEHYYLNFWKGKFLVTLTGFDAESDTIDGLLTIARAIEKKIKSQKPDYPSLVQFLWPEGKDKCKLIFLRGNLALYNFYQFEGQNIFGLKEGIMGICRNDSVLIFKYNHPQECRKRLLYSRSKLKTNSKFKWLSDREKEMLMEDRDKKIILLKQHENYLIIIISDSETKTASIFQKISRRIDQTDKKL